MTSPRAAGLRWLVAPCVMSIAGCNALLGISDPVDEGTSRADSSVDETSDGADVADVADVGLDAPEGSADAGAEAAADGDPDAAAADASDGSCATRYVDEIAKDAPLIWFRLDEPGSDSIAHDVVPSAVNGVYLGAHASRAGVLACEANAGNQLVDKSKMVVGGAPSFSTGPFTLELWVAMDLVDDLGRVVLTRFSPSDGGYLLLSSNAGLKFARSSASSAPDEVNAPPLVAMAMTHVVVTSDKALTLYVDGAMKAQLPAVSVVMPDKALDLAIGGPVNGHLATQGPGGYDELLIYDHELSAARVAAHFDAARTAK